MEALSQDENFLGLPDESIYAYDKSKVVIQQVPYEHTSSYLQGSAKGPEAIVKASAFVECYDEELDAEVVEKVGISTLPPISFEGKVDAEAVALIEENTERLLNDDKFVISLGAEHTVTLGFVKAFIKKYPKLTVLQIDAHSDLRYSYHDNIYSHASVMARVHELGVTICQAGIRAQCKEEAQLIKESENIHTFYAHQIRRNPLWMDEIIAPMSNDVYITIDADGFDPSIIPAVGTAEPNGLFWTETLELLKRVCKERNVVGFDVVECAPIEGSILSEYTLAKLVYKLIGYKFSGQ
ncbi:agmatinase [Pedobacter sp. SYSU D00535]|uniref:agmatinase n=1 Tax=Pedobacter sp. SYSU D00535 TaxID=2810308 RepID=UPI001A956806|nr:agmatinase [Pedobacter sp. SYSU D00535]